MSKLTVWFNEVDKEDLGLVGGKGANLGEMTKIGIPVPPGFIVTSLAYRQFLKENNLIERIRKLVDKCDFENTKLLQETSNLIKKSIEGGKIPKDLENEVKNCYRAVSNAKGGYVAVRSSATAEDLPTASFAGQQATFLNIRGDEGLLKALKSAWASLFEARAMFYRQEQRFDHFKVAIAVPVQQMVQSEVSGVAFTIDPVTNVKGVIVIEAIWGLGELIVQGQVTPDRYEVDKKSLKLIHKKIEKQDEQLIKIGSSTKIINVSAAYKQKQKLSNPKILELAALAKKIENHYLFPQDIEWALQDDKLYIVQTRSVTTYKKTEQKQASALSLDKLTPLLKGISASPGIASGLVKIVDSPKHLNKVLKGDVLVAEMTNPDFVVAMRRANAIVTNKGGKTSHAAIVSRELGIPCVVGTEEATKKLKDGQVITVDGSTGRVFKGAIQGPSISLPTTQTNLKSPTIKTATKVYVNLAEPERAAEVAQRNVDGVGLLRAEFMISGIGVHPKKLIKEGRSHVFVERLSDDLKTFCEAFDPRPVIYRATDFKSNEYKNLIGGAKFEEDEANPLLGYRGAIRYIKDPSVFKLELEAIKKVRNKYGLKNLWLMLPFVRTISELEETKKIISEAGLHRTNTFKLFMMVEIPSNVFLIDDFIDVGIDGVSIGSNDLTMLILGADRDNQKIATDFSELDTAVIRCFEQVVRAARKHKIMVSICGQAPSIYPELTQRLVELGITSVSVSPDAIEKTRQIIYEAEKDLVSKK